MAGHSRPKDGVASARLCPAIHVFGLRSKESHGCPGLRRAEGASAPQAGQARYYGAARHQLGDGGRAKWLQAAANIFDLMYKGSRFRAYSPISARRTTTRQSGTWSELPWRFSLTSDLKPNPKCESDLTTLAKSDWD